MPQGPVQAESTERAPTILTKVVGLTEIRSVSKSGYVERIGAATIATTLRRMPQYVELCYSNSDNFCLWH